MRGIRCWRLSIKDLESIDLQDLPVKITRDKSRIKVWWKIIQKLGQINQEDTVPLRNLIEISKEQSILEPNQNQITTTIPHRNWIAVKIVVILKVTMW